MKQIPNHSKMTELVLHIARQSEGDVYFGAVKLNKLLFYSDFIAYVRLGKSITGQVYEKQELGPVPKLLGYLKSRMLKKGHVAEREEEITGFKQRRTFALRDAKLRVFTNAELAIVSEVLAEHACDTAMKMSDVSHSFHGWKAANLREKIPYETALLRKPKLNKREVGIGRALQAAAQKALAA